MSTRLPGGRGQGEPVRLMIDFEEADDILEGFVHKPGRKLLVASKVGNGFIVPEEEVVAQTRKGKQILNLARASEPRSAARLKAIPLRFWAKIAVSSSSRSPS